MGIRKAHPRGALLGLTAAWLLLLSSGISAHEVPASVRVQVYLHAADGTLTALFRVPLQAMRDVEFATRGPGYLELENTDRQLKDAATLWLAGDFRVFQADEPLGPPELKAVRVALPGDGSFDEYASAVRAVRGERLAASTELHWEQALLDAEFAYAVDDPIGELRIEPTLGRLGLRTVTEVRLVDADGSVKSFAFIGDPGLVSLEPGVLRVLRTFLAEGFTHVLSGADHLLFLLVLVIPIGRIRPLVVVVTAFTLAHSLTLMATLFGLVPRGLWFAPLVETLIAGSIVYMALENILGVRLERRWQVAYVFGLAHGFGFSFALHDTLQFAGDHLALSLLAFNAGIELGQLLALLLVVPLLSWLVKRLDRRSRVRMAVIVASALIAHTAWHWMLTRGGMLAEYSVSLPAWSTATLAQGLRWVTLLLVSILVAWLVRRTFDRWARWSRSPRSSRKDAPGEPGGG